MDNLSILYEAYDTCEDTMMILDAYDEHTFDYIDNYMVQHESIFSKAKDYVQRHGGFLSTLKHLGNQALEFLRTMWKTFTGAVGKFIGKLISFVKSDKTINESNSAEVYGYTIKFATDHFVATSLTSNISTIKSSFIGTISGIVKYIKEFAGRQIDKLVGFISSIFKRKTGSSPNTNTPSNPATPKTPSKPTVVKIEPIIDDKNKPAEIDKKKFHKIERKKTMDGNHGRAILMKGIDPKIKNRGFGGVNSVLGSDPIDQNNKMMYAMDDAYYRAILEADDVVKAYNDFINGKFDKYADYASRMDEKMNEVSQYIYDNLNWDTDTYTDERGKTYLKGGLEKFKAAYEKLIDDIFPYRGEIGNSLLGFVDIINRYGKDFAKEKIIKFGGIFMGNEYDEDEKEQEENIKRHLKMRLNYNKHTRDILSNIIKMNKDFFQLSEIQANLLAKQIKDSSTTDMSAIKQAMGLITKMTDKFIEYPGKLNFRSIGAGVVYYNTTNTQMQHAGRDAAALFPMAMRYDYVVNTHGITYTDVPDMADIDEWPIMEVNIEGKKVEDADDLVYQLCTVVDRERRLIHKEIKPVKILLAICNTTTRGKYALRSDTIRLVEKKNIILVFSQFILSSLDTSDKPYYLEKWWKTGHIF